MTALFAPLVQIHNRERASTLTPQTRSTIGIAGTSIELHDGPDSLGAEWCELEKSAVTTVFQSHAWVSSWCRTAAPALAETPVIVTGRDEGGKLAFILPLSITHQLGMRWLGWLGQSHAGYGFGIYRRDVIARLDAKALRRLFRHIAAMRPGLAGCRLKKQPLTWNGVANPFALLTRAPSPFVATAFDLKPDFESLMSANFSSKKRSELRRTLSQLRKQSPVTIEIASTPEQRLRAFAAFQDQKSAQIAADGRASPFATAPIAAFYRDYLASDATAAQAAIGTMTVGSEIAAVDIAVIFQDRIYGLNRSMKAGDIRKSSPGRHVNSALIERAFAQACAVYDLGPGEASYKDDWNGHTVPMFSTEFPLAIPGMIAAPAFVAAAHATAALKRQPNLWNALDRLRAKIRLHRVRKKPAT